MSMHKNDQVIGLDIGSSSIKSARFIRKDGALHLVDLSLGEIPVFLDPASRNARKVAFLKDFMQGVDRAKTDIIVCLNCPKTMVKTITVPFMPKTELADAIKLEAKNFFPFPINNALLDFEVSGEITESGVKKYQLMVAVSPKETVAGYLSLLEDADIKPAAMIPGSYALRSLVNALNPKGSRQISSFLDIGESQSDLTILKGGELLFSRKIPVTGTDFTRSLTEELVSERGKIKLSPEEAENIKRESGIPEPGKPRTIADKISASQITSVFMAPLEQLVNEINMCFDYLRDDFGSAKADTLVLLGAGSSLKGLAGFLGERLGMEIKLGASLEGLKSGPAVIDKRKEILHQFVGAIGAGYRPAKGLNLLPPEMKEERESTGMNRALEIISAAAIVAAVIIYIAMKSQSGALDKKIIAVNSEFSGLQPRIKVALTRNLANSLLGGEPYWEEVLKELSNKVPANIRITGLSMDNKAIRMKGLITTKEDVDLLSNFILSLEEGIFSNVKLVTTKESAGKDSREFELTCWVD
jgi:type IV pilus assembly protein PilM